MARTLAWLVLLAVACGREPVRVPRPVTAHVPAPQPPEPTCPGGLLCEAPRPILGWRVPTGCEPKLARPRVQVCWLAKAEPARVLEFFRTRYRVDVTPEGAEVRPLVPPPLGQVAPLLQVLVRPEGVELVLMTGSAQDGAGTGGTGTTSASGRR